MNNNTIQKKMFNKLLSGERVCYMDNSAEEIGLTDGYVMYIIPKSELAISMEKMSALETSIDIVYEKQEDCQVMPTGDVKSLGNRVAVQYKCDKFKIWIDEKFSNEFDGCNFFASSPLSRVLVKTKFDKEVGVIFPIRMESEDTNVN